MGKDDKEDSGFGFKDRAKAEETLKLLEQHDPNYRRLTVRGLLGRAKRVLSLTKAEEKIKNIKEAMEVFETWLAELDSNKQKDKPEKEKKEKKEDDKEKRSSSDKDSSEDELPSESVSGLGFKDPEAARSSLKVLEGRDPDYQILAVKGLLRSAKRVLTCTKDETKLSNIKEAISILDGFVDECDSKHLSKQNNAYLSLGIVRAAGGLAGGAVSEDQKAFLAAYASVKGEYKRLRNVGEEGHTWDIRRNKALKELKEKYSEAKLFNGDEPTPEHIQMLLWAYSPEAAKVKKVVKEDLPAVDKLNIDRKRKSSGDGGCDSKKKKE